jgi:hypothetical protein
MFGLALRTYQKRIQRVTESASERGATLWQSLYDFVDKQSPTRRRIAERFARDNEREVSAVLHDLVGSGLVFVTGAGQHAVYGTTSEALRYRLVTLEDGEALGNLVWMLVFRGEASTLDELVQVLGLDRDRIASALRLLDDAGRVTNERGRLVARNLVIPLGAGSGMETAMLDHFRAVCKVLARKATRLASGERDDQEGGSTFTFTVHDAHPFAEEVRGLFARARNETQTLWDRVAAYNQTHGIPANSTRVTHYVGQVADLAEEEEV